MYKILFTSNQLKKINVIKKQEYKSIAYSDRNKKAKYAPEYSVLKPDTSSDSDSLKSKGARWVSANIQINQTGNNKLYNKLLIEKKLIIEKEEIQKINITTKVLITAS